MKKIILSLSTLLFLIIPLTISAFHLDYRGNAINLEGVDFGTMTDTQICVYDVTNTEVDCNATNAPTATALATNPTDCGAGTWATTIAANGNLTCSDIDLIINSVDAQTCAAGVGKSALTITPTVSSYVEITNADVDGCDITIGETGISVGTLVTLCVVSNAGLTVDFADTAGVTELAGAFAANIDDCLTLRYGNTTTWREVSRSAN